MSSSDEEDFAIIDSTQPEISEKQKRNIKSQEKYETVYESFMQWNKNNQSLSENILVNYFNELSEKYKPISLWPIYSMLKATILPKHGIDIKKYTKLTGLLKQLCAGATPKKSPALSAEGIEKFLNEAPDHKYLSAKVALIFAITGTCGSLQLTQITTKDIEQHGKMLLVKVPNPKNQVPRTFVIHGEYFEIVKKYQALRPKNAKDDRFFQTYHNGKCVAQPIGVNTFGAMPKEIAKFLGLPNADSYNAYSFKRTSNVLQTGIRKFRVTGGRIKDVKNNKTTEKSSSGLHSEPHHNKSTPFEPDESNHEQDPFSSHENTMLPIYVNVKSKPDSHLSSPCEDGDGQNFIQTFQTPDNNVTYNFNNCHFSNCFNK